MAPEEKHIGIDLLTSYLAGEASPDERARVEEWITLSGDNRREFDNLKEIWDKVGTVSPEFQIDLDKEWNYHKTKIGLAGEREQKGRSVMPTFLRVAASIVLLIALSVTGYYFLKVKTVKTQLAETRELTLPDGSIVTLNALSRLKYDRNFNKKTRRVSLEGEAYFQVHHDASRPFIITTGQAEIKVLGTAFNVKAYKNMDDVELVVTEGIVSLYDKNQPGKVVKATAGERATFNRKSLALSVKPNTDRNVIAWKTRNMVFENEKLDAVMNLIGEVYHKKVVFNNSALRKCTLTTHFENRDLQSVIKVLESTLGITIELKGDVLIVSGEGC